MYHVKVTRKKDGLEQFAAGSVEFDFSYKAFKDCVKEFSKILKDKGAVANLTWQNEYVRVDLLEGRAPMTLTSWRDENWTKAALV